VRTSAAELATPRRGAVIEEQRAARPTFVQRTAIWIPAGVIGLLMLPLAVTSRTYGDDWTLHLWLVRQQQMNIQANGRPGLFLSARPPLGAFYPIFAFVGSGLYTVGAYLAILLGGRPILAYKLLYLCALCLAYGGTTWLSWQVGLRRWRSQMPGLVFVTGTYFVADMFARGDLGEVMALSAIPFLIAAVTAVALSSRLKPGHLLAVTLAVFVLTGSHNITLLYGAIFLALLALMLLGAYAPSRLARLAWWRLPALLAAAAIGIGLNAWYLLVDVKYSLSTAVAKQSRQKMPSDHTDWWRLLNPLTRPSHLFGNDIRASLPLFFAIWAIAVAAFAWRRIDRVGRRLIVLLTVVAGLYVLLIVSPTPWRSFPHVLYNIQFRWRLHAYVLLATALLVMVVLVWQARANEASRRATSAVLTVITVFTVGAATWQAWSVPSTYHANNHDLRAPSNFADTVVADPFVQPTIWYGFNEFRLLNRPVLDLKSAHQLTVPESEVRGSKFSGLLDVRNGPLPFRTNIAAGPPLVSMTGIEPVGITPSGFVVAHRAPGTPESGPVEVTIEQGTSRLLRTGARISRLSLDALAVLAAFLLWPIFTWLRTRFAPVLRRLTANDVGDRFGGGPLPRTNGIRRQPATSLRRYDPSSDDIPAARGSPRSRS
jgi:hypothetical protein